MKNKLKIVETFSGIGAQHKALTNLGNDIDFEIIATSDWDVNAILSYASIHYPNFEKIVEDPSEEDLKKFIKENSLSRNGKSEVKISEEYTREKVLWYKAFKVTKNIGSIIESTKKFADLIERKGRIDVLTYSFPCQDLSSGGNFHGGGAGIKEDTRSGLLLEIEKVIKNLAKMKFSDEQRLEKGGSLLNNALPKVLVLENVMGLIGPQNRADFERWISELDKLGYRTIWGKIDSSNFGLLQKRKRIFAVSFLDPNNKMDMQFGENLNQILLDIRNSRNIKKQTNLDVYDFANKHIRDSELCAMKETPSRVKMLEKGPKINENFEGPYFTVTTKQDRNPNLGAIKFKNNLKDKNGIRYLNWRYITPRETYKLMGFTSVDYNNAKEILSQANKSEITVREKLWMQAGNSIAVNVLEDIFIFINKEIGNVNK